jgi:hypothetical protein
VRDAIRAVQALRKERGLRHSEQITLEVEEELRPLFQNYRAAIEAEIHGMVGRKQENTLHVRLCLEGGKIIASA